MACSDDCSSIVLGSQDGNVWNLNKEGETRWKYPAGAWVNGVGVSRDGSVIAAGALDGTVYILDKDGNLLTQTKTDTNIQQQSVAVSKEGNRIVVADEGAMYGYDLVGDPKVTYKETPVQTTLSPCTSSTPRPCKNNPANNRSIHKSDNTARNNQHPKISTYPVSCNHCISRSAVYSHET